VRAVLSLGFSRPASISCLLLSTISCESRKRGVGGDCGDRYCLWGDISICSSSILSEGVTDWEESEHKEQVAETVGDERGDEEEQQEAREEFQTGRKENLAIWPE